MVKKSLVAALLLFAASLPGREAGAQLNWVRLTLAGGAGFASFDDSLRIDDGIPFEGRAGLTFGRYLGVEGTYGKVLADSEIDPDRDFPVDHLGADVVLNLIPTSLLNPYLLGGWAELRFDTSGERIDLNGWEFGGGIKVAILRREGIRMDLRLEARDVMVEKDEDEWGHNIFATGGLHFEFFGSDRDSDRDGVSDHSDDCPNTRLGATVNSRGCTIDTDKDGVPDGLDLCAGSPAGAVVDVKGCPLDTDGDGVINGIDECEGTPAGSIVDARGCTTDADSDGIPDGLDACANTPLGLHVDRYGCPKDSDKDGVFDGADLCEGTPAGVKVDEKGCPVPANEMEKDLVNTGVIQLNNIYFDTGSARIKPESHRILHEVAAVIVRWPSLKIEIGGHADAVGADEYNLTLSRNRAHSVMDFLVSNYEELRFDQFFVRGYGETQPVDSNETAEGRAKNRRVEFKVLNREALPTK